MDGLDGNRVDIFDETLFTFGNDPYKQHLTTLLYESINHFTIQDNTEFIQSFFEGSRDITRMLTAINRLEKKSARDAVATKLDTINVEEFIKDARTVTQLENALLEASNSSNHYGKADVLLNRIERHMNQRETEDYPSRIFLFQIKLLLAFKQEDFDGMKDLEVPNLKYSPRTNEFAKQERRKQYYIALFMLYHHKNYRASIQQLETLLTQEPTNIDFAFHLYRARLLNATQS